MVGVFLVDTNSHFEPSKKHEAVRFLTVFQVGIAWDVYNPPEAQDATVTHHQDDMTIFRIPESLPTYTPPFLDDRILGQWVSG